MQPLKEELPKIIAVAGPTGAGKSDISLALAHQFNGEIINIDSRQFYQELPLATNQPTTNELGQIPHHFIGFRKAGQPVNISDFQKLAYRKIKEVIKRNHLPILDGGSGLYLRAITENYQFTDTKPNLTLRKQLERMSLSELQQKAKLIDPQADMDWKNPRRLMRFIENNGQPSRQTGKPLFNVLKIGVIPNLVELKQKLDKRAGLIWKNGLVEEIKNFVKKYPKADTPLNTIIYFPIIKNYLDKTITKIEALKQMAIKDYQLAKRQITWLKKEPNLRTVKNFSTLERLATKFLSDES